MKRTMNRARRGFTLVEAIAALTIIGTLGSIASRVVYSSVSSVRDGSDRAELHAEASNAMSTIMTTLRDLARTSSGGANITSVTSTSIVCNTTQTYALSGGTLNFSDTAQGGASQPVLRNVTAFDIKCYDQDGTALATSLSGSGIDPVRRIQVTITVAKNGLTETIRTRTFLRNTMQGAG
jgi:prepilin-type N-terminal cleavage/methylation domain-containing protein